MAKVEITTEGIKGTIKVDGVEVPGVHSYSLNHEAGNIPVFQMNVLASELTLDGNGFIPALPEVFRPFYEHKPTV